MRWVVAVVVVDTQGACGRFRASMDRSFGGQVFYALQEVMVGVGEFLGELGHFGEGFDEVVQMVGGPGVAGLDPDGGGEFGRCYAGDAVTVLGVSEEAVQAVFPGVWRYLAESRVSASSSLRGAAWWYWQFVLLFNFLFQALLGEWGWRWREAFYLPQGVWPCR